MVFLWFCIVLLAVGVVKHPGFGLGIWAQILIYFHITKGAKLAPKSNPKRAPKGAKEGQNQPQEGPKRGSKKGSRNPGGKSSRVQVLDFGWFWRQVGANFGRKIDSQNMENDQNTRTQGPGSTGSSGQQNLVGFRGFK